jgi:hypothetical protein
LESHVKHAPQATERLGNVLRARRVVWALSNQASTLLRGQPWAIALAPLLVGATGTNIVILIETLSQRGAARCWGIDL